MRLAIADDSTLFRQGLARLLSAARVDVAYEAKNAEELITFVDHEPLDAVIVDIRMPPTFTDEGLRAFDYIRVHHPNVGVLILSTYAETPYALHVVENSQSGRVGYLLKDGITDLATLMDALHRIRSGETVVEPEIVRRLIERHTENMQMDSLTARERTVLECMAEGRSNAGIGQVLHLSSRTVEAHVASIFHKLSIPPRDDVNRRVLAVLNWLRIPKRDEGSI
jgi:DNA-binding NarL/FixJ family response regulator